jgi:hypothetical protein
VGLAGQTALIFGAAAWRVRRGSLPVLGGRDALAETLAGVVALVLLAHATPPALRATSTFWAEPYTVISALVLAAAASRVGAGAGATGCLMVTYLVCVLDPALTDADRATAWTNALSYLPFFAIGTLGFALLRVVVAQTEALRRLLARFAAERARVATAGRAYRTGHDLPKAILREVRRDLLPAEDLRPWAADYRERLLSLLSGEEQPVIDLRTELRALARVFATAVGERVDLDGLGELPPEAPTLLIVEATRELLNNASYHAYGYPVSLRVRSTAEQLDLTVHDDGPGVDPLALASAWARKQNSVHQFEAADGCCRIVSGAGTTVTLSWPSRGTSAPGGE